MDLIWQGNRLTTPGGVFHIGYVPPVTHPLLDKVGNAYTTVIIGSQEWTVEYLKTTKYANGSNLFGITGSTTPNFYTGWTNTSWNTFTSEQYNIQLDIHSAIEPSGTLGRADTEFRHLLVGDVIYIAYYLKMNSGTKPQFHLVEQSFGVQQTSGTVEGEWVTTMTVAQEGDYAVRFESSNLGTNCSMMLSLHKNTYDWGWKELSIGGYCSYNNDTGNTAIYGLLYNWIAGNSSKNLAYFSRNGVQETGWRVPVEADFFTLATTIGGVDYGGGKLKATGFTHWNSPNTGATNQYGFNGLGTGIRNYSDGSYGYLKNFGTLLSSDQHNITDGVHWNLFADYTMFQENSSTKRGGFSVRCVRDVV